MRTEEYRRNAADCLRQADKTKDPAEKTLLLDMARAWHSLAEQARTNSRTDIVYETPPEPQQPVAQQQQQIEPKKKEED